MNNSEVLLRIENLRKYYSTSRAFPWRKRLPIRAVDDVSFSISRGETFALVGESGSGKTTTGRLILRLTQPSAGKVYFGDKEVFGLGSRDMRSLRRSMQMVFQDPYGSLNPRMTVGDTVSEALIIHNIVPRRQRRERVTELLRTVGLEPSHATRYPHEFSGGQRQRIGIARALAVEPTFVVADEPVSALDVSVQAQILNLMRDLQARFGLTYLFIAHNLAVVRYVSDRVAVMYMGRLVELAPTESLFAEPLHPYTRMLLDSVPVPDPTRRKGRGQKDREPAWSDEEGCRFSSRCSGATGECREEEPELVERAPGHFVACYRS